MIEYKELHANDELEQVWESSTEKPVLLFKHSTTCPISAKAYGQFQTFLESADQALDSYLVKVIEDRAVSNQIAEMTDVKHESPQIFLIKDKEILWHTSHSKITVENIGEAVRGVAK
ncbi:general stress protein [Virgibacillus profundi]|uniref:General stress protein n=1 Tax=Virgibacillus profundi TaxID=2024555 RepID=A0A2A2IC94_9BACI|nr:bacillithiol system redox-active protein YtxJ [Virgibacillus profundi]PAV29631.1 general stress protein [Virgibacillus profundi]PXY53803.1 bacillithiol system redox-active protein YtxJ [Virgibacillus profundi]